MGTRKSPEEIQRMALAGRVVAEMHEVCARAARPGATTLDIDRAAREVLDRRGAASNFLGYHGFPAVICTSPNAVVVHGIPDSTVLSDGDLISLDCGAIVDGWHADAAITVPVGDIDAESAQLIDVTRRALARAIEELVVGQNLADVGGAAEEVAEAAGFSMVREYVGHGIGTAMHEDPDVPNYRTQRGRRHRIRSGLVVAIEPMVTSGSPETEVLDDGWTVVTVDGQRAAHFEHTIAVTDNGPQILTLPG
jgi:methionyl aminopeptidase